MQFFSLTFFSDFFFRQKCLMIIPGKFQMPLCFWNIAVQNVITNAPNWTVLEYMLPKIMIYPASSLKKLKVAKSQTYFQHCPIFITKLLVLDLFNRLVHFPFEDLTSLRNRWKICNFWWIMLKTSLFWPSLFYFWSMLLKLTYLVFDPFRNNFIS